MTDTKQKQASSLREPKPKKKLGLAVPQPLRMPHEELVRPDNTQAHEVEQTRTSQTSQTSQTSLTSLTRPFQAAHHPVSPVRDFTKVANSITREAIPAGLFKGKSKQLYDYLYSVTRGAIVPSRSVRLSRPKLMTAAGIGSRVTFDANIERLSAAGLVRVRSIAGEHEGNEYTVFLPEEINTSMPRQTSLSSETSHAQKLDRLVCLETRQTSHSLSADSSILSGLSNTSSNTNIDDDDGGTSFWAIINQVAREVLGNDLPYSEQERDRWRECATVLGDELRRAAARAGSVSSVPAFFAAHLRRRFKVRQEGERKLRPAPHLMRDQPRVLSTEERVMKMIKELRSLHVGDPGYQESDLIDDLKFRCDRDGLAWDEEKVLTLVSTAQDHSH